MNYLKIATDETLKWKLRSVDYVKWFLFYWQVKYTKKHTNIFDNLIPDELKTLK